MAGEARIMSNLFIQKLDATTGQIVLEYQSRPSACQADVSGTKGPVPGAITVSPFTTSIDLTQLTSPGLCRVMNQTADEIVELGILDVETSKFYPMIEIRPYESFVFRLSSVLGLEYGTGAGTGATGPQTNRLAARGKSGYGILLVEAFDA